MRGKLLLLATLLLVFPAGRQGSETTVDLLIREARVLDGSGNPWFLADVAIRGDRIVSVSKGETITAKRTISVKGLYLAPGFIDVHSHAGPGLATAELSSAEPLLAQGVTTVVVNPDGGGPVDLAQQREALLRDGLGVNVVQLVPHGSVRRRVLGMENRPPRAGELEEMKALVESGMTQGAFGLSSGLFYAPGSFADTEELIELARVAGRWAGVYTSHIRDEADYSVGLVAAVDEVIRVSEEAGLPGVVTHIKALGPRVWGFSTALVQRIERARRRGVEVYADQYPYTASGTGITGALVPRWALEGGNGALKSRLASPDVRQRLRTDMLENLDRRGGADRLQFRRFAPDPSIEGRTLGEVAREKTLDAVDLALQLLEQGGAALVSFNMIEADLQTLMVPVWTMTSSDGGLVPMGQGVPHPRNYGTFPRKIRRYVVDEQVLDLASAVRSMTSLPAQVFGIPDRGMVRPGLVADLVVFDLEELTDKATYDQPHQLSQGMVHVFVAGRPAVESGRFQPVLAGQVLQRR